jgi:8-oxo-dGTP pyrophosphatase MutT (NUDIX family)
MKGAASHLYLTQINLTKYWPISCYDHTMHYLQQNILRKLILNEAQRYADLKPTEIEGNLFMYHLRSLMREGYVEKREDGRYGLTGDGQSYADRLSLTSFKPRIQARIVTLLAVQDADGRWLMFRRSRQPLLGKVGFPYGKIHEGETIAKAAARELVEKTGLKADLVHRGDGYIAIHEGGVAVSHIMFHLFAGTNPKGDLRAEIATGTSFWAHPITVSRDELMPSVPDLLDLMARHDERFFVELDYK